MTERPADVRRMWRAAAAIAVAVPVAASASCGMVGALGDDDAGAQTATVGVLVPREGWQAADGAGVQAAVEAAIAATTADIPGWTVEVVPVDEGDDGGAAGVEKLIDENGVAVVGGLGTAAVRAVQPIADAADVLFVSPADVDPAHTRGADPADPLRPYSSYYRTAVSDEAPTVTLARYAVNGLDAEAVAMADGGDPAEAQEFAAAVRDAGGEVVAAGAVSGAAALDRLVNEMGKESARAVYVAGSTDVAADVARRVADAGLDVDVLGTSAVFDDAFADEAGAAAQGIVTALPARLEPTAGLRPDGLAAELEADGEPGLGEYGAAAYDAATAVGTVLARCLPPASSALAAREGCTGEMIQVDFAGVTGEVAFDGFGDRAGATPELRVLRDGRWQQLPGR